MASPASSVTGGSHRMPFTAHSLSVWQVGSHVLGNTVGDPFPPSRADMGMIRSSTAVGGAYHTHRLLLMLSSRVSSSSLVGLGLGLGLG